VSDRNHRGTDAPAGTSGPVAAGLLVFAGAFLLYLRTNYPFVATGDNAEFQALAATGGIAHAGYPTFVLALQAFGQLPWSTVAFRANLLVGLCGAAGCALAAYEGARLSRRAWAGAAAGAALALSYTLWQSSTVAEIYAFTLVPAALLYLLARRLAVRPGVPLAAAAGALGGLGIGSHLTILALAPVVLLGVGMAARAGRLRGAHVAALLVGFALGLAPFAAFVAHDRLDDPMNYLAVRTPPGPARDAAHVRPIPARLGDAVFLLTGRQYLGTHGNIRDAHASALRGRYLLFDLLLNEWFGLGLPLALLGAFALWRRRGVERWLLGAWIACAAFLVWYAAIGMDLLGQFFIGGLWVIAVAVAVGLATVARRAPWLGAVCALALVAAPFVRLVLPEPAGIPLSAQWTWERMPADWDPWRVDRSWDTFGRGVDAALPPHAVVLGDWAEAMTLKYFKVAARLRPDVDVVLTEDPGRLAANARNALAQGRPATTTFAGADTLHLPGLVVRPLGQWPAGKLWQIEAAPPRR